MRKFFVICKIATNKKLSETNVLEALKSQNNLVFFENKEDAENYYNHSGEINFHHKIIPIHFEDASPALEEIKSNKFRFTWKNEWRDEKIEFEYINNHFKITSPSDNLKLRIQKNSDESIEIIRWIDRDIFKFMFYKGGILTDINENKWKETYIIKMIENFTPIDTYPSLRQNNFILNTAKNEKKIIVEVALEKSGLDLFPKRLKAEWAEQTGKCVFTKDPLDFTEERISHEHDYQIQYLTTNSPDQARDKSDTNFNITYRMSNCIDFLSYNYAYEPGKENNKVVFSPIHRKLGLLRDYLKNSTDRKTESQLLKVIKIDELHVLFAKLKNENIESPAMNDARKKLTEMLQSRETLHKWLLGIVTVGIGLFFWKSSNIKKITVNFDQYHSGLQAFWKTAKYFNFSHQFSDSNKRVDDKINTYENKDAYKQVLQQKATQLGFNHQEELRKLVTFDNKKMRVEGTLFQTKRCTFFVNFSQQYKKIKSKEQKLNRSFERVYHDVQNKFSQIQLSLAKYQNNSFLHGHAEVEEIKNAIQHLANPDCNNHLELLKPLKKSIATLLKTHNYLEKADKKLLNLTMKHCVEFKNKLEILTKQKDQIEVEMKNAFSKTQHLLQESKNASDKLVRQNKI